MLYSLLRTNLEGLTLSLTQQNWFLHSLQVFYTATRPVYCYYLICLFETDRLTTSMLKHLKKRLEFFGLWQATHTRSLLLRRVQCMCYYSAIGLSIGPLFLISSFCSILIYCMFSISKCIYPLDAMQNSESNALTYYQHFPKRTTTFKYHQDTRQYFKNS